MARQDPRQAGFDIEEPDTVPPDAPLAARMRPATLDEYAGQEHIVGPGTLLRSALDNGRVPSLILWGPPGSGKTTLARLVAHYVDARFVTLSAVGSGVAELRQAIAKAQAERTAGRRTVLFIDEIHRFNKAQQDVVLPHVEDGTVTLIGATTENPSFEVVAPLLSRVRVLHLQALGDDHVAALVDRALTDHDRGIAAFGLELASDAREQLVAGSNGDARAALTVLELAADLAREAGTLVIDTTHVGHALSDRRPYHDRAGDAHFDTVSALIKSMRGSDPDAALYWLARMVEAGEDPLFIVRRMVIFAAEDVGLADPQALNVATSCQQAVHFVGMPEGYLPMAECAAYLALAPKSNSAYTGYGAALEAARETGHLPVPNHLRNAPTALARQEGHGEDYRYPHDEPGHFAAGVEYLPRGVRGAPFFQPGETGWEARAWERLQQLRSRGASAQDDPGNHP